MATETGKTPDLETIPNEKKSAKDNPGPCWGTVLLIWILVLALVSDWKARPLLRIRYGGIRISNFVSPVELGAVMRALQRATRPCVLGGDSLGR